MKKCIWCESEIEDNATTCPYCKTNQNMNTNSKPNHIKNYLDSDTNKSQHNDDIHQIAQDLRFIKNVMVISLILLIILGFINGLSVL